MTSEEKAESFAVVSTTEDTIKFSSNIPKKEKDEIKAGIGKFFKVKKEGTGWIQFKGTAFHMGHGPETFAEDLLSFILGAMHANGWAIVSINHISHCQIYYFKR